MKVIAVEEHLATPAVMNAWAAVEGVDHDDTTDFYRVQGEAPLLDLGEARLAWMDEMGIDVQILSLTTPGVQVLEAGAAVELAGQTNDLIAATVSAHPDRFGGLATLPTPDPEAAALELRRCVGELGMQGAITFGRTRERNLDHPANEPIFAAAAEMRAPLFVHPQIPQRRVRDSIYSGLPGNLDFALSIAGLGWHYEAGVQFLRLALSGVLDRYPDLRFILGHWGDLLVFYLDEIAVLPKLAGVDSRPISDYFEKHVYVAPSGTLSRRYLDWAVEVLGIDRLLFALDYPFARRLPGDVETFFEESGLDETDREKLAWRNWEGLVERIRS